MVKLIKVIFEYMDGTKYMIHDPRAAALFQSRCNSSGILSGMESEVVPCGEDVKDESTSKENK